MMNAALYTNFRIGVVGLSHATGVSISEGINARSSSDGKGSYLLNVLNYRRKAVL